MNAQHTPEPWRVFEDDTKAIVTEANPMLSLMTVGDDGLATMYEEADARRAVACVNACAGIPTEQLEIEPYIGSVSYKMRMQAEKQRDELLAALKYAASVLDTDGHDPIIDAAIANAEARS